jgi:hypothetical protein
MRRLGRDLTRQYRTAFIVAHKLRDSLAADQATARLESRAERTRCRPPRQQQAHLAAPARQRRRRFNKFCILAEVREPQVGPQRLLRIEI